MMHPQHMYIYRLLAAEYMLLGPCTLFFYLEVILYTAWHYRTLAMAMSHGAGLTWATCTP